MEEESEDTTVGVVGMEEGEGVQDPLFPKDLFTPQQNRQGAVVFHIIGRYIAISLFLSFPFNKGLQVESMVII